MARRRPKESIGERLERLRRERGLTQQELAEQVGIAQPNLSDYERGESLPAAPTIIRLAQILGVSADTILGLEPLKAKPESLDRAVLRRMRKLEGLSRRDRQAMLRVFDAMLERNTGVQRRAGSG